MTGLRKLYFQCKLCYKALERVSIKQLPVVYYSSIKSEGNIEPTNEKKLSKAMKSYLERAKNYNEFMKKEEDSFNIGKRHLANMMGVDPETFTQDQIDEAIEYLLPSGLFEKKARPFMKPPHLVFPPKKDAEFDETGRPFHFLFYTGKPNFYNIMHDTVGKLKHLNDIETKIRRGKLTAEKPTPLDLTGSVWLPKEELERNLVETLSDAEYNNYVQVMERLATHIYAAEVKEFILKQRKPLMESSMSFQPSEPQVDVDGRKFILTKDCPRKNARADVKVISPGTGLITINGQGIEYFPSMQCRNQLLFPLELTGLRGSVDIEATVRGGGETGQAGAIRWGISWGLRCFVSPEVFESMRLAGLLTRDYRRRERKKPGQAGARRKFTWKRR